MNPFKKLAGQTAIYGLPTIVARLLNYFLVPLFTRIFLTAEYGVVTEMYAYVAVLFAILTYGMETSYFRYATTYPDKQRVYGTSLASLITTSLLFVLVVFMSAPTLSQAIGYSNHPEYLKWFALILAADAITSIPYAHLRLSNRPLRFAIIKITNILVNIGFNLFFLVYIPARITHDPVLFESSFLRHFYAPSIGVGYIFISNLIASLITLLMLSPEILKAKIKPDLAILKNMLSYGWPLLIFSLAGIINETFDRVIMKHMLPDGVDAMAQLGIYGACYKVSILMSLFIQTYRYAAEPFFFESSKNKDAKETYAKLMNYFLIICFLIYLSVMLFLDFVILFIGEDFREGAAVIPILLWANLFLGVFYNLSVWFKLTDKTRIGAMISVAGAIVTLILNIVLIPAIGYMGAAWATFICYAFMMILSWLIGQKYYPVKYDLNSAGIYAFATIVIYIISLFTDDLEPGLKYSLNALLILLYLTVVAIKEKVLARILHKQI